jgi:hypothetical protein
MSSMDRVLQSSFETSKRLGQGDQIGLWKLAQNVAQPIFVKFKIDLVVLEKVPKNMRYVRNFPKTA